MAFDCICIDFQNKESKKNIEIIKEKFPYVEMRPFIKSYKNIIDFFVNHSKTEYIWILSSLCNYKKFDFDYIPEQFERKQIHTWSVEGQDEGDTFLITKEYLKQKIKFLRDYKDINYHISHTIEYDFSMEEHSYDLSNCVESLPKFTQPSYQYICYKIKDSQKSKFFPSYWEDLKIVQDNEIFYIPKIALLDIKTDLYDYNLIYKKNLLHKKDCFDITYISNGEPFEQKHFDILKTHVEKNKLPNRLFWTRNVLGRTAAYKKAAEDSTTEYFYAVFAKSVVDENFLFDFTIDRAKSKRHYIFHADLLEVGVQYGTFNTSLYNKTLCLETNNDNVLDFTLSKPHEVVPVVANRAILAPDNYTAWKNGFREVSKLIYWNNLKPTIETSYRIKKWLNCKNEWLAKGAHDGKKYVEETNFEHSELLKTYTWDFCREKFKTLYPLQNFY
jgi:hypothetical protein